MGRKNRGFSLVELTLVLLLLALVAGAVTLRVQGPLRRSRMQDALDQVRGFDRLARHFAAEQDRPIRLVIDLDTQKFWRAEKGKDAPLGSVFELPSGVAVTKVRLGSEELAAGRVELPCSRAGLTPSYALCVSGPKNDLRWLLFSGLTGESSELDNEQSVRDILEKVGPRRNPG
jgi:prepilin-type N-terminal cleavage/methylation domain-containing protein